MVGEYLETAHTVDEASRPTSPTLAVPGAVARRLTDERHGSMAPINQREEVITTGDHSQLPAA